jgi:hypothetical protein
MKKGQGSLEYLLILAAILAIAVVVVVVAQSMLAPGKAAGATTTDKYNCGLAGIELTSYDTSYTGSGLTEAPAWGVSYANSPCTYNKDATAKSASCTIGTNKATVKVDATGGTCIWDA